MMTVTASGKKTAGTGRGRCPVKLDVHVGVFRRAGGRRVWGQR